MASTNYRLFNRICHSKLFNCATSRIILAQKQCLSTLHSKISITNTHRLSNNLHSKHYSFTFSTKADDTDSDLSDFSDLSSDSDSGSDIEDAQTKFQSKPKQSEKNDTKKEWKFGHDDISEDMLMKDRLIVSNLNFSTNRNDVWELCENYGTVTDVHLPSNKNRDFHNRGFGFITFETEKDAQNALDNVAGVMFNSRQLRAGFARKDTEKPSKHNPTSQKLRDRDDFHFAANTSNAAQYNTVAMDPSTVNNNNIEIGQVSKGLNETVITVNGLPGNVNLAQITKMFNEFGTIANITFSPYQMMGHSFMNAIVSVKLQQTQQMSGNTPQTSTLSFQEREIKDRSVQKSDMGAVRRDMNPNRNRNGNRNNMDRNMHTQQNNNAQNKSGIDPDVLAKEIDELLADTDESDSNSDSDSDSDSDDSSSDKESSSSSDSDSDRKK